MKRREFLALLGMSAGAASLPGGSLSALDEESPTFAALDTEVDEESTNIVLRMVWQVNTHIALCGYMPKMMFLPSHEFAQLERELIATVRYVDTETAQRGYEHLLIKGVPVIRTPSTTEALLGQPRPPRPTIEQQEANPWKPII